MNNKIILIGCGNVGMAYAYSLINQKTVVDELIIIDTNEQKAQGEVLDLNHCLQFANTKMQIKVGTYDDCKNAKIIVITAGANQMPNETRMDLIYKNNKIFKSIVANIMEKKFNGIILVATNPLDVMTYLTLYYSRLPKNKVIGSGTTLDTSRLHFYLSEKMKINSKDIKAYVIGEHGDTEFIPWSNARINSKLIADFLNNNEQAEIEEKVRNAAYEIINKKGSTAYGIGICLTAITNAILENQNVVLSVSSYDKENNVCISMPTIVNNEGIKEKLPVSLNQEEQKKLMHSIDTIKKAINLVMEDKHE